MKKVIYYFSGTGNSLAVARDIAQNIGASLVPVISLLGEKSISVSGDTIGIVFPLQDFKAPPPVADFVSRLSDLNGKYIFAVCTYGLKPAHSLARLDKLLQSHGGRLACGFAVKMPHNGIASGRFSGSAVFRDISAWKKRVPSVCDVINRHEKKALESSPPIFNFFSINTLKSFGTLMRFVSVLLFRGVEGLRFSADCHCIGCGVCQKVCSVNNITLEGGKPVWGNACVNCFACINWCAQGAITLGGQHFSMMPYHHPEVTSDNMRLSH